MQLGSCNCRADMLWVQVFLLDESLSPSTSQELAWATFGTRARDVREVSFGALTMSCDCCCCSAVDNDECKLRCARTWRRCHVRARRTVCWGTRWWARRACNQAGACGCAAASRWHAWRGAGAAGSPLGIWSRCLIYACPRTVLSRCAALSRLGRRVCGAQCPCAAARTHRRFLAGVCAYVACLRRQGTSCCNGACGQAERGAGKLNCAGSSALIQGMCIATSRAALRYRRHIAQACAGTRAPAQQ